MATSSHPFQLLGLNAYFWIVLFGGAQLSAGELSDAHIYYAKELSQSQPGVYTNSGVIYVISEYPDAVSKRTGLMKCMYSSRDQLFAYIERTYYPEKYDCRDCFLGETFPELINLLIRERPLDLKDEFDVKVNTRVLESEYSSNGTYRYVIALSEEDLVRALPEESPYLKTDDRVLRALSNLIDQILDYDQQDVMMALLKSVSGAVLESDLLIADSVIEKSKVTTQVESVDTSIAVEAEPEQPTSFKLIDHLEKAIKPQNPVLWRFVSEFTTALHAGEPTTGLNSVNPLVVEIRKSDQEQGSHYYMLAEKAFRQGDALSLVQNYLELSLASDATNVGAWNLLGRILYLDGKVQDAGCCFLRGVYCGELNPYIYTNLAMVLNDLGFKEEAICCALIGWIASVSSAYSKDVVEKLIPRVL